MTRFLSQIINRRVLGPLRRFARGQDGVVSIEVAMLLPVFIFFFVSAFETGLLMTRQVMLDRGMDIAIRSVRLGTMATVTPATLRAAICNNALVIPNCATKLRIEMRTVDLLNWVDVPTQPECEDMASPSAPLETFQRGQANQMVVVRACALFEPVFPTIGFGERVKKETGNYYGLVSVSAFVREPL